ncbi:MAG: hypothetical protein COA75_11940 [Cellvibrionales bacterium]|nr:MAG: hypothetical protein COA75_11940 [Cellvibrionales bacterium]
MLESMSVPRAYSVARALAAWGVQLILKDLPDLLSQNEEGLNFLSMKYVKLFRSSLSTSGLSVMHKQINFGDILYV